MAALRFVALLYVFALLAFYNSLGMPSGKLRAKRQTSALATLMSFSVKLSDMERLINSYEKKIKRQDLEIDQLAATIDSKADRSQFQAVERLMNSKMSTIRNDINNKELVIERYRNNLRQIEGQITEVQLNYAKLDDLTTQVKSKFDDFGLDCSQMRTGWAPRGNGPIMFLDRHWLRCNQNQFLQSFLLKMASNYEGDMVRYLYRCCRLIL